MFFKSKKAGYLSRTPIFVSMKWRRIIFPIIVAALLFAACNRDNDPVDVAYFSSLVYLQNDTVFTESSVESRALYNTLMAQIKAVGNDYNRDTVILTTWGQRNNTCFKNDSIELVRFVTTSHQLDIFIKDHFNAQKAHVRHDGSFRVRVSIFVAREHKLAESHSINYIFEE